jgi:hypothetical protein
MPLLDKGRPGRSSSGEKDIGRLAAYRPALGRMLLPAPKARRSSGRTGAAISARRATRVRSSDAIGDPARARAERNDVTSKGDQANEDQRE